MTLDDLMAPTITDVPRGTFSGPYYRPAARPAQLRPANRYRAGYQRPEAAAGMGAFGVRDAAAFYGTDPKTLLLVGISGIAAGFLLHVAVQRVRSAAASARRRASEARRQAAEKFNAPISTVNFDITPRNLLIAALLAGGAWYVYSKVSTPRYPAGVR